MSKLISVIAILTIVVIGLCIFFDNSTQISSKHNFEQNNISTSLPLGLSFPPVSTTEQLVFTRIALEDLQIDRIRFSEDWRLREKTSENFSWEPLDARIEWAKNNGVQIFLTIQSNGPDWQCDKKNDKSCVFNDTTAFQNYIETLLQRHPNQIRKIQFGNEWQTTHWYAGSAEEFVVAANILHEAVQQYSPQTVVVLGGFTTNSLRFLAACSGKTNGILMDDGTYITGKDVTSVCASEEYRKGLQRVEFVLENTKYDEVDIHLYDDPEYWTMYHQAITAYTESPIVVSEFGGPHSLVESTDAAYQASRLQDYITTLETLNITEAYYFKLVEGTNNQIHQGSSLFTSKLKKKPSYDVFRQYTTTRHNSVQTVTQ